MEEALDMVSKVISLDLESALEHGEEVPVEIPGTLIGEVEISSDTFQPVKEASSPEG